MAKTVDGVTTAYVLDPAAGLTQVLQEATDGQATSYLYGHDLLAQYDSGTWAYHVNDGLGSVRQLADPVGQVVQGYSFSPFGVPLGESGGEPYGFAGEQWDASAGLVFLRARYYNPSVSIFTSKDPLAGDPRRPQTFNGYMYANQNPLRYRDPSGYDGEDVTEFLMGVVYQWIANNYDALGISAKSQLRAGAEEVAEQHRNSVPFQIGRFTGSMIGIGQAIWEVGVGVGIMGCGGVGELTTGWTGVGAVASGGVVAVGAAVTAHGVVVGVVSAAHMGDIAGNIYWAVGEGGGSSADNHKVYVVRDPDTGEVIYVGRTKRDLEIRGKEHSREIGREDWKLELVKDNLSYDEARHWEQKLIDQYGGIEKLENKIRAVAPEKWQMLVDMFEK